MLSQYWPEHWPEIWLVLTVAGTFIVAGMVKGALGVGLPTVSIAILAATIGLHKAIPIILVPSIVTNVWQGATGGYFLYVVRKIWLFLLATAATIFVGVGVASGVDGSALSMFLGLALCAYAVVGMAGVVISVPHERLGRIGAGVGCVNGLLTGLTGSFMFPGIPFIKSIDMPRDATMQALGIFMTMASFLLTVALVAHGRYPVDLGMVSAFSVVPAMMGMIIGRRLRDHLSEAGFNRLFLACMLFMGVYIILSSLGFPS